MLVSSSAELTPLTVEDAPRCAELERILFPGDDPWSAQAFRDEVRIGHHYLAARDGDRLVGYAGLAFVSSPPQAEAEVHTIGVDPAHQHRGIGRALLRGLLTAADEQRATVFLEVRTDNDTARALYESEGFAVVGIRKRYYRPSGADAHTMRREARELPATEPTPA
jgi:[ribosomal protein S18]-alanine N-acetyltransferase